MGRRGHPPFGGMGTAASREEYPFMEHRPCSMRDSARAAPWIAMGRMRRADDGSGPEPQRGVFRLRRGCLIRSHVLDVVADPHQTIRYRPARRSYQPCRS